jgi:hypothetical protein
MAGIARDLGGIHSDLDRDRLHCSLRLYGVELARTFHLAANFVTADNGLGKLHR